MKRCKTFTINLILALVLLPLMTIEGLYAEEQCLKDAWNAFNKKDYENAIRFAGICIDDLGNAAARAHSKFDDDGAQCPATGAVSDADKNKTFANGLLNDVATAFFIKGRSAEYISVNAEAENSSYKEMAEEAYEEACKYRCGRAWDQRGWFWSPCEAAADRLPINEET